ncbi:trxr-1 [Pristionchus pacificus]|uniref:thioredoxin-disulfide reductase (NADPH) n=1 Tax=Pristionchus pacificus TaxID=54126 RepID=A0A2A6CAT1_PRIPA|nr:trxr-1 [Pristionchus pacificus]|eukprot:PDM75294.1 trxr-1 [Pristionchus pacificus]
MSKQVYKRYLRLVTQWPKDQHKNPSRDLAVYLGKQVEAAFAKDAPTLNASLCEKKLNSLEQILSNKWADAYPHNYKSGSFGLTLEQVEQLTSDTSRKQLGLAPKKGILKSLFSFLPISSNRSYSTVSSHSLLSSRMGAVVAVLRGCSTKEGEGEDKRLPDPGGGRTSSMYRASAMEERGANGKEAFKKATEAKVAVVFTGQKTEALPGKPKTDAWYALYRAHNARKAAICYLEENEEEKKRITSILHEAGVTEMEEILVKESALPEIEKYTGLKGMPIVFIKGCPVGDESAVRSVVEGGRLSEWVKDHEYDLIVIGGGSGGLAAAKEAASLGWKVACLDFVKPSPLGTSWGLGGTCVNVGCIPKKLMHQSALLGHSINDARSFGWKLPPKAEIVHDWKILKQNVQDHIGSLNWGYRVALREKTVNYVNGYGVFTGTHEISATDKKGKVTKLTADRFLLATGLRPRYPEIPGAKEYCVTSDDLFSLPYSPGKTLCVGASYVSLECAGFLKGMGYDVSVMVRSILLRGFDQDIAERIRKQMADDGIKFVSSVPTRVEELEPRTKESAGRLKVYFNLKKEDGTEEETSEEFNTVLIAIGRDAVTADLGLNLPGVRMDKNGKIVGRRTEQSFTCPYVYAVGDVLSGCPELTPVAIHAGRALMRRLKGKMELTDYDAIPTTVFTPLEYGCCGLSEEAAIARFGKEDVIVYHNVFLPLEYTVPDRKEKEHCYLKLVCRASDHDRILGFHILCPSAGEVTQGFGIALKLNAKKEDFDTLIGIHPTVAENFTTLTLVKKEGDEELKATGC